MSLKYICDIQNLLTTKTITKVKKKTKKKLTAIVFQHFLL